MCRMAFSLQNVWRGHSHHHPIFTKWVISQIWAGTLASLLHVSILPPKDNFSKSKRRTQGSLIWAWHWLCSGLRENKDIYSSLMIKPGQRKGFRENHIWTSLCVYRHRFCRDRRMHKVPAYFSTELGTSWALRLILEFYSFEQSTVTRKHQS